jgi:hypothetical protein
MVSGRGGNHPAGTFVSVEQKQLVERAALLEGAGALQIFELQINLVGGGL